MPGKRQQPAVNDNGNAPKIRVMVAENLPLNTVEVEIFDTLISNIDELTANDNEMPREKEPKR